MQFYVGTYTRLGGPGVAVCRLDDELELLSTASLPDPSYVILSADQKTLYSISGDPDGAACAAFAVQGQELKEIWRQDTGATGPCHLCLSPDERFLYTANYSSGSLTVLPLDPPGAYIQLIRHEGKSVNPDRQKGPHVHYVSFVPGSNVLAVVDLGLDAVVFYDQDEKSGLLTERERLQCEPGLGPRHLVFAGPDTAWLLHELGNKVSTIKKTDQGWQTVQTLDTLPLSWSGENTCAAIRTDGHHVFASNRGHDSIAVYRIRQDQTLQGVGVFSSGGENPRDFDVLPDGRVLVAHQAGTVVAQQWDRKGEVMRPTGQELALAGAVCICPQI